MCGGGGVYVQVYLGRLSLLEKQGYCCCLFLCFCNLILASILLFIVQAKAIALHHELFSVENGFLTPTFKAKRPAVKTAFMETFVRLYHELPQ